MFPELHKPDILLLFLGFSHYRISSILPSTNTARRRLISGVTSISPFIHKLVKPGKIIRC